VCLRNGFEVLDFTEIAALAFPENEPSIRVMRKLGFVVEDIVRLLLTASRGFDSCRPTRRNRGVLQWCP
jgi:RimJ/RimL family protein N-acetyltransferase